MTRNEKLAYLAGIVDGEGYVGIKRGRRRDAINFIYHERIQVRMTDEDAIAFLAKTLGGSYYRESARCKNGKPLFCWQASDARGALILAELMPFLRVKRAVAKTVLRLRRSKNDPRARRRGSPARRTMSPKVIAIRESLYLACKAHNRTGID
jgi:hypothetical protein